MEINIFLCRFSRNLVQFALNLEGNLTIVATLELDQSNSQNVMFNTTIVLFTVDIMSIYRMKSIGVTNNINDGSFHLGVLVPGLYCCAC